VNNYHVTRSTFFMKQKQGNRMLKI